MTEAEATEPAAESEHEPEQQKQDHEQEQEQEQEPEQLEPALPGCSRIEAQALQAMPAETRDRLLTPLHNAPWPQFAASLPWEEALVAIAQAEVAARAETGVWPEPEPGPLAPLPADEVQAGATAWLGRLGADTTWIGAVPDDLPADDQVAAGDGWDEPAPRVHRTWRRPLRLPGLTR